MRPAQSLFILLFALTVLYCPNLEPLLLVGRQIPPCKLTIASEYFAGMKPLATFRAAINSISIRNKILLITPVVHILSHRRRSVLEQAEHSVAKRFIEGLKARLSAPLYTPFVYFLNHFNPVPLPGLSFKHSLNLTFCNKIRLVFIQCHRHRSYLRHERVVHVDARKREFFLISDSM